MNTTLVDCRGRAEQRGSICAIRLFEIRDPIDVFLILFFSFLFFSSFEGERETNLYMTTKGIRLPHGKVEHHDFFARSDGNIRG